MWLPVIVMLISFAAVGGLTLAAGLLLFDIFGKPKKTPTSNELDLEHVEKYLAERHTERGYLDRTLVRLVEEAGSPVNPPTALAIIAGAAIIGCLAPLLLMENMLLAAVGTGFGVALPLMWLSVTRWFRLRNMYKHLPEGLQIIADAVRSGLNLEESCDLVAREIKGPLGVEFGFAAAQLRLGQSPVVVMERMVRRVPLAEFRVFATAVLVHRRAGGNLPPLTQRISQTAHERQEVRGHLMAVSAGSRLSAVGMVIGSILAATVLAWMEPDYLGKFLTHPLGPSLLVVVVCLQLTGMVWVWRILKVSY